MPTGAIDPKRVSLREITQETVVSVIKLEVAADQRGFVAPNAVSLAQALFSDAAWYRAIYLDDDPAGFVMLYDETLRTPTPERPQVDVWRFMIDERFQRRGVGRVAMQLVIEHVRAMGRTTTLELSYVPGEGSAEPFYRGLGFQPTGRMEGDEVVLELPL